MSEDTTTEVVETETAEPVNEIDAALEQLEGVELAHYEDDEVDPPAEDVEKPAEEVEDEAEEPKKDEEPLSPADERRTKLIAKLTRKEGELLERETAYKQSVEAFEARRAEVEKTASRLVEMQELSKTDPVKFVEEVGGAGFIDRLSKALINGEAPKQVDPEIARMRKELDELRGSAKQREEERAKQSAAAEEAQRLQVVRRVADDMIGFVAKSEDKFPLVAALDSKESSEMLLGITRQHWDRTKQFLDFDAAAQQAEEVLRAKYERFHKAATKTGSASQAAETPSDKGKAPRTLSKSHGSRTTNLPANATDEERLAAASELLEQVNFPD